MLAILLLRSQPPLSPSLDSFQTGSGQTYTSLSLSIYIYMYMGFRRSATICHKLCSSNIQLSMATYMGSTPLS